jgi:hypothetical protein
VIRQDLISADAKTKAAFKESSRNFNR